MHRPARVGVVVALLFAICGMGVHYAVAADDHDRTRIGHDRLRAYQENVGETAFFWADVAALDRGVRVSAPGGTVRVVGATQAVETRLATVERGDVLQVYGTLRPDRVVRARRVIVSDGSGLAVTYAVSALGGLLALAVFVRRWRFDRDQLAFVPRGEEDA